MDLTEDCPRKGLPSSLSVVIPCYNEEDVLFKLRDRLTKVLGEVGVPYEIILVDDGSRDSTWKILSEFAEQDNNFYVMRLSRNYGHQLALTCGLDAAKGEVVLIMDADLQDPPELLPEMLARWSEGYSVIYGQRVKREGESQAKRFFAFAFYRLIEKISRIRIPRDTGDFRLLDRKALEALNSLREKHRFIRGMVSWIGFPQIAVKYERPERVAGETKYPFKKSFLLAVDAIISFSYAPLKAATYAGLALIALSVLFAIFAVFGFFLSSANFTIISAAFLVIVAITFVGGIQLLAMGMIGEYVGRIFEQGQMRPLYFVDQVRGKSLGDCKDR